LEWRGREELKKTSHWETLLYILVNKYYYNDQKKLEGMGGSCSMHTTYEKFMLSCSQQTRMCHHQLVLCTITS
jgi:hypothetical protein